MFLSLECEDTHGWKDDRGFSCLDWVGYDCSAKHENYTDKEMREVLHHCCASCKKTVGKHRFSFEYSI